ncbi:lipopolysaccharide biosynthesis protein [Kineococcus sp. SYSU DK005]|uniref:lipopolysaccharide biosynthesis protein n=1 Tax=Kineococcus sp. SYSU DK005 TaxID=3383126 RepID=UPI003D7ED940
MAPAETTGSAWRLRRTLILTTAASAVGPLAGLATAPILAHSLGVTGRGQFSAALAPGLIVASLASFGLPDALTYHLARRRSQTLQTLGRSVLLTTAIALPLIALVAVLAPVLSQGDEALGRLIIIAAALCLPGVYLGLVRGVAVGQQMWRAITAEKLVVGIGRLILLATLALLGHLTALVAVLVSCLVPVATAGLYWRVFVPGRDQEPSSVPEEGLFRSLVAFGARAWAGSVAVMVLSKINPVLLTPLASVEQVGLLAVAITIADVPYIFTTSVRDVLFGVGSATADVERLAQVGRLTLLLSLLGSAAVGATLPFWIGPLFGDSFTAAIPTTLILLASQVFSVPGLMLGAAAASLGRPGLRSSAQALALVVNVAGLLAFAGHFGALGAAFASVLDTTAVLLLSSVMVRRIPQVRVRDFVLVRGADVRFLWSHLWDAAGRFRRR